MLKIIKKYYVFRTIKWLYKQQIQFPWENAFLPSDYFIWPGICIFCPSPRRRLLWFVEMIVIVLLIGYLDVFKFLRLEYSFNFIGCTFVILCCCVLRISAKLFNNKITQIFVVKVWIWYSNDFWVETIVQLLDY